MRQLNLDFQECCRAEMNFPFNGMPFVCDYEYYYYTNFIYSSMFGEYEPLQLFNGEYNDPRIQLAFAKCFTCGLDFGGCCARSKYTSQYP